MSIHRPRVLAAFVVTACAFALSACATHTGGGPRILLLEPMERMVPDGLQQVDATAESQIGLKIQGAEVAGARDFAFGQGPLSSAPPALQNTRDD